MPIIASAIKKLRKDKKREKLNRAKKSRVQEAIKRAQKSRNAADARQAIRLIDKAVKVGLFHKNKASRLKSRLSAKSKSASAASVAQKQRQPQRKAGTPKRKKSSTTV